MSDFVESTSEASRGGFQGIKKVRGLLISLKRVPPRWTESEFGEPKEQIEITLEEAVILEMFPGEEDFELKENKFVGWIPYQTATATAAGKTPHANSSFMKCFLASAERLGKKPTEFIGQYVTLDKIPTVLFKQTVVGEDKKPILDEDGAKQYTEIKVDNVWCFIADETADSENIKDYIRGIVTGLNQKAALRKLLVDSRAKQFPEFKEALNNGTLADMLELTIVDEKFQNEGE